MLLSFRMLYVKIIIYIFGAKKKKIVDICLFLDKYFEERRKINILFVTNTWRSTLISTKFN